MSGAKIRKEREPMPDRPTPRSFAASVMRTFCALVVPWLVVGCASFQQAPQESPSLHVLQTGALPAKAPRFAASISPGPPPEITAKPASDNRRAMRSAFA